MTTTPRLSILLAARPCQGGEATRADRIRALYAELRAGDLRSALARLAPNVEWEEDRGGPDLPIRRKHLGQIAVARLLSDPQGLPRALELVHLVESGREVAVLAAEGPSPEPEGVAPLRIEAHLWNLDEDGRVLRFRQVASPGRPAAPTRH